MDTQRKISQQNNFMIEKAILLSILVIILLTPIIYMLYISFKPKPKREKPMFRSYNPISVIIMALLVTAIDIVKTTIEEFVTDASGSIAGTPIVTNIVTLTLDDAEATKIVWDESLCLPSVGDAIIKNEDGTYRLEKHADFVAHYA